MVAILRRRALVTGIALGAFVCSSALWLGSALAPPPTALVELFHWPLRILGLLLAIGLLAVWALAVLVVGPTKHRAWSLLVVLSLVSAIAWTRFHTDLGAFALGGANYWVTKASAAANPNEREHYLRLLLSATQYGPNIAEGVVAAYPPQEQVALFESLASTTESAVWRQRYRELADRARQASGMLPIPSLQRSTGRPIS